MEVEHIVWCIDLADVELLWPCLWLPPLSLCVHLTLMAALSRALLKRLHYSHHYYERYDYCYYKYSYGKCNALDDRSHNDHVPKDLVILVLLLSTVVILNKHYV